MPVRVETGAEVVRGHVEHVRTPPPGASLQPPPMRWSRAPTRPSAPAVAPRPARNRRLDTDADSPLLVAHASSVRSGFSGTVGPSEGRQTRRVRATASVPSPSRSGPHVPVVGCRHRTGLDRGRCDTGRGDRRAPRRDDGEDARRAAAPSAELHVIDPAPEFDPAEHERAFPGRYVFHRAAEPRRAAVAPGHGRRADRRRPQLVHGVQRAEAPRRRRPAQLARRSPC